MQAHHVCVHPHLHSRQQEVTEAHLLVVMCLQARHARDHQGVQAGSIEQQENGKPNFNLLCSRASYPRSLKVQLGACSAHLCQQLPDALPQCREGCFLP